MRKAFSVLKKPSRFIPLLILLGVGGWIYVKVTTPAPVPELAKAMRGTITQEISITGTVKPAESIDLGFTKNGRVRALNVEVGSKVGAGQILAELDASQLKAQLEQAQANVASANAKLDELLGGTRSEQLDLRKTQLANAVQAANDAERNLQAAISSAATQADDAVHNQTDVLFSNPRTSPQIVFATTNSQLKSTVESSRANTELVLVKWNASLSQNTVSVDAQAKLSLDSLDQIRGYLDALSNLVNTLTTGGGLDATTITSYRTSVSTARTSVNTAVTALSASQEKLNASKSAVAVAERQLALDVAGATPEAIAAAQAGVKEAEASVASLNVQIQDSVLRSPISGTIIKTDVHVGEIVAPNATVISIISGGALEITADVPEVDISKISVGGATAMTLDAVPGETFNGKVSYIEPSEKVIEGVPTYKTTFTFKDLGAKVKPGMTANLNIVGAQHENVIYVPQRAVINKDGKRMVQLYRGENEPPEDRVVTVGLRDINGNVEIVSGLSEGEEVIRSPK